MNSIELFTGAGGLALGCHFSGFKHSKLIELNDHASDTIRANIQSCRGLSASPHLDISDWSFEQADIVGLVEDGYFDQWRERDIKLIAGGVPCQPFSLGGKHLGKDDERNLFPEFVRIVDSVRPSAFVVENVKGLKRKSFFNYFQYILRQLEYPQISRLQMESWESHTHRLEKIKTRDKEPNQYSVVTKLLNAADFGVPQHRERVFIVGFRKDLGVEWTFPEITYSKERLIYEQWVSKEYLDRNRVSTLPPQIKEPSDKIVAELTANPPKEAPWKTIREATSDLPEPRLNGWDKWSGHILRVGARSYPGHTGSPLDYPAKTLKAGVHGVPGGENMLVNEDGSVRYFSVREAARLQTFPDYWRFEGSWSEAMRQIGNAVPVALAKVIADSVISALTDAKS